MGRVASGMRVGLQHAWDARAVQRAHKGAAVEGTPPHRQAPCPSSPTSTCPAAAGHRAPRPHCPPPPPHWHPSPAAAGARTLASLSEAPPNRNALPLCATMAKDERGLGAMPAFFTRSHCAGARTHARTASGVRASARVRYGGTRRSLLATAPCTPSKLVGTRRTQAPQASTSAAPVQPNQLGRHGTAGRARAPRSWPGPAPTCRPPPCRAPAQGRRRRGAAGRARGRAWHVGVRTARGGVHARAQGQDGV